ncbi:Pr6Pr family membrane protein [Actinoplanes sp. NEAU-A12]|uniref:Pr6Pr family membrane protein n=1 Tax=Actinoplanes sandaracinus TaxID=3045177 RepID=A0ABT6WYN3_9ACTN|nr:Pr6Pr family membrane protein [Actinoplanes sandaracinus]MDI6104851.1 Pr6Pr family membrane protein [Actinoplanes sandaracinus]
MNGSRVYARLWHGLLAVVVLGSLVTQMVLTAQGSPGADGVVQPAVTRFVRLFSYFTIQSNILLLIVSVTLALNPDRDGRLWRVIRLDAVLGIIITGLVYATVLAGVANPTGAGRWSNLGFHYVAPWWALLGWLLFGPRTRMDKRTLGWAVVWPILWIGYTFAHGAATDWYPYPFASVTDLGYGAAVRNMVFVVLIAVLFGAILWALDRRLPGGHSVTVFSVPLAEVDEAVAGVDRSSAGAAGVGRLE